MPSSAAIRCRPEPGGRLGQAVAKLIKITVYANSDDAFVAWAPDEFIANCLGFQLERGQRTGRREQVEIVQNRVGFATDKAKSGDHRPSGTWPFQRFNWTDHAVDVGNEVRYRVTAMLRNGPGALTAGLASDWSPWTKLTAEAGDGFSCYFNRGLILSQFVARYLKAKRITPEELKAGLMTSADPSFRAFLQGDLGVKLFQLLSDAKGRAAELHAALYELSDDAIEAAMTEVGSRLDLILANGSDKSGDGNADARKRMRTAGVPTIDRLLKSKGLGHNKFLVRSDAGGPNRGLDGQHELEHHGPVHADQQWPADRGRDGRQALPPAMDAAAGCLATLSRPGELSTWPRAGQRQTAGFQGWRGKGHGVVHPHFGRPRHGCPSGADRLGTGLDPVPHVHAGAGWAAYAGRATR